MKMNRIRTLRLASQRKQLDLARQLNISQSALSNWERGRNDPDTGQLAALAAIFDVTIDYLLGRSDMPNLIPEDLKGIHAGFYRSEFEGLTRDEIEALAVVAKTLKAQRK